MTDTDVDESITELSSLIKRPTMQDETSSLSDKSSVEPSQTSAQTHSTQMEVSSKSMPLEESTDSPATAAEANHTVENTDVSVKNGADENARVEPDESATAENTVVNDNGLNLPEDNVSRDSSIEGDMCRICHSVGDDSESLISPCNCCGSMKWVHQRCLQTWVKSRDARKCELCGYLFNMTSSVKPLRKWKKMDMPSVERRRLLCQVTFHVVAITCVIWSLYVLIDRTTQELQDGQLNWPFWTKLVVVAVGFTGGLVFMYVQCKTYVKLFRRWKQFNRVIYINDARVLGIEKSTENSETNQTVVVEMSNASTTNAAPAEQPSDVIKRQANPA